MKFEFLIFGPFFRVKYASADSIKPTLTIFKEGEIDRSKIIQNVRKQKKWSQKSYACLTENFFYLFTNIQTFYAMVSFQPYTVETKISFHITNLGNSSWASESDIFSSILGFRKRVIKQTEIMTKNLICAHAKLRLSQNLRNVKILYRLLMKIVLPKLYFSLMINWTQENGSRLFELVLQLYVR